MAVSFLGNLKAKFFQAYPNIADGQILQKSGSGLIGVSLIIGSDFEGTIWGNNLTPGSGTLTLNSHALVLNNSLNLNSDGVGARTLNIGAGGTLGSAAWAASSAFDVAGAASAAQSFSIQRSNHTGTQSADTITDGTTNKAFLATERSKLTGIAAGATVNSLDSFLLNRTNHTGTQSADTLTDGSTNKAFLATERTKLSGIASGATLNSTDSYLLSRANHTGTQSADTLVDGVTNGFYTLTERIKLAGISAGATTVSSADPSASIGLSSIVGTATTFMRSDAAPALNQAIVPTWTGQHTFNAGLTASSGAFATSPGAIFFSVPIIGTGTQANSLVLRNGTTAQTFQVYGTYTDASNYRRASLSENTSGVLTISSEGLGTGATGNTTLIKNDGSTVATFNSAGSGNALQMSGSVAAANFNATGYFFSTAGSGVMMYSFGSGSTGWLINRDVTNGLTINSGAGNQIWQDPATAASGTVANRYLFGIGAPTLTATNTGVTDTVASTVYIGGAPVAGTNTTIGTAYALNVASGISNFGGGISATTGTFSGLLKTGNSSSAGLFSTSFGGLYWSSNGYAVLTNAASNSVAALGFGGVTQSFTRIGFDPTNGLVLQSGQGTTTFTDSSTAASGTVANRAILWLPAPTLTAANTGVTDTVASTLYIDGAPIAGTNTTIGAAYALNVNSGNSNFGGTVTATGQISTAVNNGALGIKVGGTNTGLAEASGQFYLFANGSVAMRFSGTSVCLANNTQLGWGSSGASVSNPDTILFRDTAGSLALRNGTSAQNFSVYGTYTDGSNYRRASLSESTAGVLTLSSEGLGTGATGNTTLIKNDGSTVVAINASGTASTTTTTGAAVITGGLGVSGTVNSGGNGVFAGILQSTGYILNLTASGPVFYAGSGVAYGWLINRDAPNGITLNSGTGNGIWQDNTTAASGTVTNRYLFGIGAPTLTATNTGVTDTIASTVYIGGAPTAGTNTTIGTSYALNVASGVTNLGGGASLSGSILFSPDSTYNIGASGANRPANIYVSTQAFATLGFISDTHASAGKWSLLGISNGVARFADSTGADFNRLQFGTSGVISPALKSSSTVSLTATVTIATPGVFTSTAHGFIVGDVVSFTTTGALPTGIVANVNYYVSSVPNTTTFSVAVTLGGASINTTGTQSGVHTVNRAVALYARSADNTLDVLLTAKSVIASNDLAVSAVNSTSGNPTKIFEVVPSDGLGGNLTIRSTVGSSSLVVSARGDTGLPQIKSATGGLVLVAPSFLIANTSFAGTYLFPSANTLSIQSTTNAQTLQVHGTYTDASNYRRASLSESTAGVLTLSSEGLGTGATGNTTLIKNDGTTVAAFNASGTASTSRTTGALVVTGGLGVSGDLYASILNSLSDRINFANSSITVGGSTDITLNNYNGGNGGGSLISSTNRLSSGSRTGLSLNNLHLQTATAGGTDFSIVRTETSLGSGTQLFLDFKVGATSKFTLTNSGKATFSDDIEMTTSGTGVIIKDTGDGTRRRITISNGVIVISAGF